MVKVIVEEATGHVLKGRGVLLKENKKFKTGEPKKAALTI
jgi:hypothetical protein